MFNEIEVSDVQKEMAKNLFREGVKNVEDFHNKLTPSLYCLIDHLDKEGVTKLIKSLEKLN